MCSKEHAHEHTGSAEAIRPSLRNGFTAYFVLSPVIGFLVTVASGSFRRLDAGVEASGPHDFAVRTSTARLAVPLASTASRPAFRDDREPPLLRNGTATNKPLIWGDLESRIFFKADLDSPNQPDPIEEIRVCVQPDLTAKSASVETSPRAP
jgi:hypothetical protein